jgi:hypothetical protein
MNEQVLTTAQMDDPEFQKFLVKVTPPGQVRKVWIGTVIMILYYIFKVLETLGFFEKFLLMRRVKKAMKQPFEFDQERELAKIKAELSWYDKD